MFKDQMLRQGLPDQVDKEAIKISNIDYDGCRGLVTFEQGLRYARQDHRL
jgi:hypothetical protein